MHDTFLLNLEPRKLDMGMWVCIIIIYHISEDIVRLISFHGPQNLYCGTFNKEHLSVILMGSYLSPGTIFWSRFASIGLKTWMVNTGINTRHYMPVFAEIWENDTIWLMQNDTVWLFFEPFKIWLLFMLASFFQEKRQIS